MPKSKRKVQKKVHQKGASFSPVAAGKMLPTKDATNVGHERLRKALSEIRADEGAMKYLPKNETDLDRLRIQRASEMLTGTRLRLLVKIAKAFADDELADASN